MFFICIMEMRGLNQYTYYVKIIVYNVPLVDCTIIILPHRL